MGQDFANPKFSDILVDDLINNGIGRFVYKDYIKTIHFRGDETVLEFGCGSGALSRHLIKVLSKNGGKLTGIDISEFWADRAEKRLKKYKNAEFAVGDIREKDFKAESFDAAIIHYVLHHVEKESRKSTVCEIYRLLKKGGKLYIKEPHKKTDGMPVSEIEELTEAAGFTKIASSDGKNVFSAVYKK